MESWTSIWTASPEVDLVSFDGAMVIFRVNGIPKMRDVERLLREAYEHGLCSAEELRDYYRKHMASEMIQRDSRPMTFEPAKPKKKDRTLLKSIVLLFLLLLPNGLFFWSLLFKMLGSGI